MKGIVEAASFGGIALALHVALWAGLPGGGVPGAGEGGRDVVTIEGAHPAMAALVAAWDRPVEVADPVAPVAAVRPVAPPLEGTTARSDPVPPPLPLQRAPALPVQEAGPTQPLPPPQPRPQVRDPDEATPRPLARRSAAAAPAPAARQAAGAGGDRVEGRGTADSPSPSDAGRVSALAAWGGQIRAQVQRSAPRVALRGNVHLALEVGRDGTLHDVSVAVRSGHAALDAAALRAVRSAGRFPPAPATLAGGRHRFTLPLRFE
ncbi:MAG: energy transducer TonB family protein [Alkalilacustris sp.]